MPEPVECRREHGVDKTLFQSYDHRARRISSLVWRLDRLSRHRLSGRRAEEKDRSAAAKLKFQRGV